MKRIFTPILIVSIIAISLINIPVFAGSINGPEAGLIGAASGTFTYNGKSYVAAPGYLSQLKAYLSQDSIDLTQSQADRAVDLMYSNVKGGVYEGYLIPADGSSAEDEKEETAEQNKKKTPGVKTEKAGKADVEISDLNSVIKIESEDGESIFSAELPVKNTGIDLSGFMIFFLVLIFCIPISIFASWKLKLFRR